MSDVIRGMRLAGRRIGTLALLASIAGTAGSAGAQQPSSSAPWRAWLGCWSAGGVTPLGADASLPIVCVTPTASAEAVQISTIADGKVIASQRVDASGREVPLDAKNCSGTQTGRWSADGRRVYLNAAATCDGVLRTTSGILAITPTGEWLDIQGVRVGETENVRVARYRDIGMRSSVPVDIAATLSNGDLSVSTARAVAGATIGTTAVVEASKATGVGVTEAFVIARGQPFDLNASQLVSLADAGVPTRLTDAMIAISNPQTFSINQPQIAPRDTVYNDLATRRVYVALDPYMSPWGWGYGPYGYSPYGSPYSPYGYSAYGLGYGGLGYGYGYPGYVYSPGQIVIVRGTTPATTHGRMVKGRGYQPPTATATTPSVDRAPSREPRPAPAPSPSNEGSSRASERTAKPRP